MKKSRRSRASSRPCPSLPPLPPPPSPPMSADEDPLPAEFAEVEDLLGYSFSDASLIAEALTHPSVTEHASYQRLEFVGDAALGLAFAKHFFLTKPSLGPGKMTVLRAANTSTEKLARVAVRHGLYRFLRRNTPPVLDQMVEEFTMVVEKEGWPYGGSSVKAPKVLADVVESIAAAVYVDCGFNLDKFWEVFRGILEPIITVETQIIAVETRDEQAVAALYQKKGESVDFKNWREESLNITDAFVDGELLRIGSSEQKDIAKLNDAGDALRNPSTPEPTEMETDANRPKPVYSWVPKKDLDDVGTKRKHPTLSAHNVEQFIETPLTSVEPEAPSQAIKRRTKKIATHSKKPALSSPSFSSDDDVSIIREGPNDCYGPSQQPDSSTKTRPNGCSMLKSIENHIAYQIWNDPDTSRMLTVVNHRNKCNTWRFDQLAEVVKVKIKPTGLQNLAKYAYKTVDNALISAFVERWHPETNTFHLPEGEMTITLDDVHHILGLRVDGRVMMNDNFSKKDFEWYDEIVKHVSNSLGVDAETLTTLPHFRKSYGIPLRYLEKTFNAMEAVGDNVDLVTRGYMQFILGAVGIPDKSGMSHAKYILNFADLSTVEEISWGSSILAHLYRELGVASRVGSKTISGCQTLLHAWIYEHFPMLNRATLNEGYDEHLPRMCRWKPTEEDAKDPHTLVALRNALEDMKGEEIVWHPHRNLRSSSRPLQPVSLLHGLLSCHDIEEPYMPDRVLRQFGYVQTVPTCSLKMVSAPKGTKSLNYVPAKYNWVSDFFNERQCHVIRDSEQQAVVEISDCSDEYIAYYEDVGHPMLLNPNNRKGDKVTVASPLPAKSVLYAALLKMANKAKRLGEILVSCKGENYIEINEQLQNIDNIIDFPFFENRE